MKVHQIFFVCLFSICPGCTPKPPVMDTARDDSVDVELVNIFKEVYANDPVKPPPVQARALGPTTVESLYADWEAELTSGIVGIHTNPDGSKTLVGPGFGDAKRIPHLVSCKRLADFRPRIEMVNYCISQFNTGNPVAGLVGHVLKAAYPDQLSGLNQQEIFQKARRLAEAERP